MMASSTASATGQMAAIRKSIDGLLADVGSLLADLTSQEHPTGSAEDEENEEARRPIDIALHSFWDSYYELKRRHEENALSVAVLALTKSGKSTLLNALMGMEVLPMNNVPETARICRISHDSASREPQLRDAAGRTVARGEAAVRARLQQLNSAARTGAGGAGGLLPPQAAAADACGGGSVPDGLGLKSSVLNICAPLVALGEEGYGAELGRVVLLDTPGPNEAGEEQLKHQVERLLEGVDCVLYLLDYTKLKTAEEEGLFRRLRAINPQLVARLSSRLFFVINKIDAVETSEGLDPDEVRSYVADLVTRQLGGAAAAATAAASAALASSPSSGLPSTPRASSLPAAATTAGSPLPSPGSPFSPFTASAAIPFSPSAAAAAAPASPYAASAASAALSAAPSSPSPSSFRLHPDQVLLLSARNALLARLVLAGRAGPETTRRFQRLAFGAFGSLGLGRSGGAAGPSQEQLRAAAGCLLEGSGIPELEGRVLAFLAAHAASVKLLATADDTTRLLAQVRNVALACRSCLHANVAALQAQAGALRGQLAEAGAAFEEVRQRTDAVQAEVVAEIKAHLNTLRRRLFTHIIQTLDTDTRAPPPPAPAPAPAVSPWARVREKFLSMFTAATTSGLPPPPHPHRGGGGSAGACGSGSAAAGGGGVGGGGGGGGGFGARLAAPSARSRSREELQSLLLELHDDLMGQIHSEVYDFWGVLEACAAARHSELLAALNTQLAALSARLEGAVAEALGVQLAPADIRLRPPSPEQLHSDVQQLIEKGIREGSEKHIRVGSRTTTERVLRQPAGPPSLCRWGGYWVELPRTRTVVETYTATVYSLRPDEIANHFIGLVDGAVAASEAALGAHVGALVERQLAAARERLREYGDRYLAAMTASLAASSRGAESRSAALAAVEAYLARLDQLEAAAEAAQRAAEGAVPGGAAGLMDEVEVYEDEDDDDEEAVYGGQGMYGGEGEVGKGGEGEEEEVGGQEAPQQQDVGGGEKEEAQQLVVELEEVEERVGDAVAQASSAPAAATAVCSADGDAPAASVAGGAERELLPASPSRSSIPDIPDIDDVSCGEAEAPVPAAAAEAAADHLVVREPEEPGVEVGGLVPETHAAASIGEGGVAIVTTCGAPFLPSEEVEAGVVFEAAEREEAAEQGRGEGAEVPSLQHIAGAALEGPQQAAALEHPGAGGSCGEAVAGGAVAAALAGSCASVAPYSVAPFDYGRAFLRAMTGSEMAPAGSHDPEEPLTMIPLTTDCAGGPAGEGGAAAAIAADMFGHENDSPRSGASEDWQLVEEEVMEAGAGVKGK